MRTTVNLTPEAFLAAKAKAAHESISLGEAVSALIVQSVLENSGPITSQGLGSAVFRSDGGMYASQEVEAALDDE